MNCDWTPCRMAGITDPVGTHRRCLAISDLWVGKGHCSLCPVPKMADALDAIAAGREHSQLLAEAIAAMEAVRSGQ